MGIVIADCAIDFAQQVNVGNLFPLTLQAICDIGHFLPHRGGRGGLAMCMGQHWNCSIRMRHLPYRIDDFIQQGQNHLVAAFTQHQGISQVVNIFRCAGEMHELTHGIQLGIAGDFFLDEVFDGFHVVVRCAFDIFDTLRIFFREIINQPVKNLVDVITERRHFGNT